MTTGSQPISINGLPSTSCMPGERLNPAIRCLDFTRLGSTSQPLFFFIPVITQIYKARWQIELFFKWIKQNLKIKSFLGTSKNAVLTQIWVAMCYYLLLSYIKYQTKYSYSLLELSWIFSDTILERISLIDLLSCNHYNIYKIREPDLQQSLF
jgi:hypothetical protein